MKKLLLGSVALAALIAGPALATPAASPYDWTGFYLGLNAGYGWGQSQTVHVAETDGGVPTAFGSGNFGTLDPTGGFGGAQVGYNWQWDHLVLGLEADIQGGSIRDTNTATLPYLSTRSTITVASKNDMDWFGSARARLGYASDRWLVYVTGGFAFGDPKYSYKVTKDVVAVTATSGGPCCASASKGSSSGYILGAGAEYALDNNWTLGAEFDYLNFGSVTAAAPEVTSSGGAHHVRGLQPG